MSPHTTRLVRLPRLRVAAVGVTTALALTACGGQGDSDSGKTAGDDTPQGVVSRAAAKEIADRYEEVDNKANAAQDEKLLRTVEAGQVHAMDKATYTLL